MAKKKKEPQEATGEPEEPTVEEATTEESPGFFTATAVKLTPSYHGNACVAGFMDGVTGEEVQMELTWGVLRALKRKADRG